MRYALSTNVSGCFAKIDFEIYDAVLTYAAGIIVPHANRIDIYLLLRLDRQPEEWDRITSFFRDREKRIEQLFGKSVRFLLGRTDAQIFYAINCASSRDNAHSG